MALGPEIVPQLVVDVNIRFSTSLLQYHVKVSSQVKVGTHVVYEREDEHVGSWGAVIVFLTGIMSEEAATATVADHYESLTAA